MGDRDKRERENDCTDICFAALKKNKRKRERERGKEREREREIKGGRKVYLRRKRLCVCDRESEGGIE